MKHTRVLALLAGATWAMPAAAQHHDHGAGAPPTGVFGPYPMAREASGTSWQPDSTPMAGRHFAAGPWMLMVIGFADLVDDHQGGPRGDSDVFAPSMGMLMADRPAGRGRLGLRAMLSLDPAGVGRQGYPLLLQTGETSDGRTHLVDRQHPHDLFMELSASYSRPFREHGSAFAYLGYPGEPALGPPAFMHRFSGMALPESPLLHHWLDSTHITFGVATAGVVWKGAKLEASSFRGREPDQRRWNFDPPKLDSFAARLSVNPSPDWALQVSAGHLESPEQLEPVSDLDRITASASWSRPRAGGGHWQTTAAWGLNRKHGESLDGVLLESAWWSGGPHTIVGRAELVEKDELIDTGAADSPLADSHFRVGKLSLAYVHELAQRRGIRLSLGALAALHHLPAELEPVYGSHPASFMIFVRLDPRPGGGVASKP
jgi:hypothetical protein